MMDCSPSYSEPSEANKPFCSANRGQCLLNAEGGLDLFIESGAQEFLNERRTYVALGGLLEKEFSSLRLTLGISDSTSFYGSFSYTYNFLNFGLTNPNQFTSWNEPQKLKKPKTFLNIYGGSCLNTFEFRGDKWLVNQNVYAGASLVRPIFNHEFCLFSESGLGINYNLPNQKRVDPIIQVGLRFDLKRLGINGSSEGSGAGTRLL